MGKKKKPQFILVVGKRWFERTNGNTYHSVSILVEYRDGTSEKWGVDFRYGYGDHYITTAEEELESLGIIARERYHASGGVESLRSYCERNGIGCHTEVADVPRKKDL